MCIRDRFIIFKFTVAFNACAYIHQFVFINIPISYRDFCCFIALFFQYSVYIFAAYTAGITGFA